MRRHASRPPKPPSTLSLVPIEARSEQNSTVALAETTLINRAVQWSTESVLRERTVCRGFHIGVAYVQLLLQSRTKPYGESIARFPLHAPVRAVVLFIQNHLLVLWNALYRELNPNDSQGILRGSFLMLDHCACAAKRSRDPKVTRSSTIMFQNASSSERLVKFPRTIKSCLQRRCCNTTSHPVHAFLRREENDALSSPLCLLSGI